MITAFLIGLLGSLHCVGMCGPIMLAFGGANQKASGFLFYHAGRILSYLTIGLLLGTIGSFVSMLHFQQVTTLVLGIFIIVLYGVPRFRNSIEKFYYQSRFYRWIKSQVSQNLSLKKRWLISGVANGFFPCGLTYVAAAGAVAMSDFRLSFAYMLLFGLGTIPSFLMLHYSGNYLLKRFKNTIPRSLNVVALLSGVIMIYRGTLMSFPDFNAKVREGTLALMTVCGF